MEIPAEKNEVTVEVQGEATSVRGNRNLIDELIYNLAVTQCVTTKRRKSHDYYTHGGRTSDSDRQRHWYRLIPKEAQELCL